MSAPVGFPTSLFHNCYRCSSLADGVSCLVLGHCFPSAKQINRELNGVVVNKLAACLTQPNTIVRVSAIFVSQVWVISRATFRCCCNVGGYADIQRFCCVVLRTRCQSATFRIRTAIANACGQCAFHFFAKVISHSWLRILRSRNLCLNVHPFVILQRFSLITLWYRRIIGCMSTAWYHATARHGERRRHWWNRKRDEIISDVLLPFVAKQIQQTTRAGTASHRRLRSIGENSRLHSFEGYHLQDLSLESFQSGTSRRAAICLHFKNTLASPQLPQ